MRISLTTLLLCVTLLLCHADSWRSHPPFSHSVERLVDTGEAVYVASSCQPFTPGSVVNGHRALSLFRFDKASGELTALSQEKFSTSAPVTALEWAPSRKWLVTAHSDGVVCVVKEDGACDRITAFRDASMRNDRTVNNIFIDEKDGVIYLATTFGFVSLDPTTRKIKDVCNTPGNVKAISKSGKLLLILIDGEILGGPINDRGNIEGEWQTLARIEGADGLWNVGQGLTVVKGKGETDVHRLWALRPSSEGLAICELAEGYFYNIEHNPQGLTVPTGSRLLQIAPDGTIRRTLRRESDWRVTSASANGREFWFADAQKGLWSSFLSGDSWTDGILPLRPNAPTAFRTDNMVVHPDGRLLVANHGHNSLFPLNDDSGPLSLCGYKDGEWTNLTPATTPERPSEPVSNPGGPAIDPSNPEKLWFGSVLNGLECIDLSGATPTLHLSRTNDPYRNQKGFHAIVSDQNGPDSWKESCSFSKPVFDIQGNMWSVYGDFDNQSPPCIHLFLWPADGEPLSPVRMKVQGLKVSNIPLLKPLFHGESKGNLLYTSRLWGTPLSLIDLNGTPPDPTDDSIITPRFFVDQDGNYFEPERIIFIEEDPDGSLWVGCSRGIFIINPAKSDPSEWHITRIKISRNDGSGYADYLLDGVPVNDMATDRAGHRWLATSGAGLVVTSADGRTVIREYTSSDSPIPGNVVYAVTCLPGGTLMISTDSGLQELSPSLLTGGGNSSHDIKVWPNPVRPGFTGYVTIEGLPSNALVKIVDAAGNCLRQLTASPAGKVLWDVTDAAHRRPGSGVYTILCSSSDPDSSWHARSKILIVNN